MGRRGGRCNTTEGEGECERDARRTNCGRGRDHQTVGGAGKSATMFEGRSSGVREKVDRSAGTAEAAVNNDAGCSISASPIESACRYTATSHSRCTPAVRRPGVLPVPPEGTHQAPLPFKLVSSTKTNSLEVEELDTLMTASYD